MNVPFVSFKPLEKELDSQLRAAFERVYENSWYIDGNEDKAFEAAFAKYCNTDYCVGNGNGLDALMLSLISNFLFCAAIRPGRACWASYFFFSLLLSEAYQASNNTFAVSVESFM